MRRNGLKRSITEIIVLTALQVHPAVLQVRLAAHPAAAIQIHVAVTRSKSFHSIHIEIIELKIQ